MIWYPVFAAFGFVYYLPQTGMIGKLITIYMWYFNKKNKEELLKIATKKTPVYVYDLKTLQREIDKYKKTFKGVKIFYALKANSNSKICRFISQNGIGADVVSGGELLRACESGFDDIIFSGVGKTDKEIELAVSKKIFFINIESFEEFEKVAQIAKKIKIKTNISVRINPDVSIHTHKYIRTGERGSKFGVDSKTAYQIYKTASKEKYLNIKAIHFHLGSQIFETEPYIKALKKIMNFITVLNEGNIRVNTVDIGGGWGVKEGNETEGHTMLYDVIKPYVKDFNFIIEPGRSLVASSGVLLARVLYRKKVDNRYIVIVDAGMSDFIRPALYGSFHPVFNLSYKKNKIKIIDIAGPICESSDFFARNLEIPFPEQDDILLISSVGAYGYSMSSNYNLREKPEEKIISL